MVTDEFIDDAQDFQDNIKRNFLNFRTEFRNIVDKLRVTEYHTFARIGEERAQTAHSNAYDRINEEKKLIRERLQNAGGMNRALFHDLFAKEEEESEEVEDDEEFYKDEDSPGPKIDDGKIPGSIPGQAVRTGPAEPQSPLTPASAFS